MAVRVVQALFPYSIQVRCRINIVMAPKKNPEGDGILAKVIRMYKAGELDIPVDSALEKVFMCKKYQEAGGCHTRCQGDTCDQKRPIASIGWVVYCLRVGAGPASNPGVHANPVLALQAFLLANGSPLPCIFLEFLHRFSYGFI